MTPKKPVIVIVPGGFCKPAVYAQVANILRENGFTVIVPSLTVTKNLSSGDAATQEFMDLANKGLLDDVQQIHADLAPWFEQGCEAVLIGHSYGSLPAMLAIQGHTTEERSAKGLSGGIKGYAAVSGFAYTARGRNVRGNTEDAPVLSYFTHQEGIFHIQDLAKPLFFSDLPQERHDDAWNNILGSQSRKSLSFISEFLTTDIQIPKTYVLCENDEIVPPSAQEFFIKSGEFDKVERLQAGHFPFYSLPEETAKAFERIAIGGNGETR